MHIHSTSCLLSTFVSVCHMPPVSAADFVYCAQPGLASLSQCLVATAALLLVP